MPDLPPITESGIPHGTCGGYTNHRCRCEKCRAANTEKMRSYRKRHPEQVEKARKRESERYHAFKRGEYTPPRVADGGTWEARASGGKP